MRFEIHKYYEFGYLSNSRNPNEKRGKVTAQFSFYLKKFNFLTYFQFFKNNGLEKFDPHRDKN
jgi:hypothetical protein